MRNTGIVLNTNIASPQNGFQVAFHKRQFLYELFTAMLAYCTKFDPGGCHWHPQHYGPVTATLWCLVSVWQDSQGNYCMKPWLA